MSATYFMSMKTTNIKSIYLLFVSRKCIYFISRHKLHNLDNISQQEIIVQVAINFSFFATIISIILKVWLFCKCELCICINIMTTICTVCFTDISNIASMDMSWDKLLHSQDVILVPNIFKTLSPTTFSTQLVHKLSLRSCHNNEAKTAKLIIR